MANGVVQSVRNGGHFIVAQDTIEYMGGDVSRYFSQFGLRALNVARTWNIYGLTTEQREQASRGRSIEVDNDVIVLDLVKY